MREEQPQSLDLDSPLRWSNETLKELKTKLDEADCISVASGNPVTIGWQISLMAALLVSTMQGIVSDFLPKYQEYNMAELKERVTTIFIKPLQKS